MDYTIRPIKLSDAAGLAAMRRMPGVFETILGHPTVRDDQSEKFIAALGEDNFQLAAEANGTLIGACGLSVNTTPRMRHSGSIGLLVHKDWQGQGVGTALMSAMLDMADNWLMLARVELGVFTDNAKAIKLYEKMGFVAEGVKRRAVIQNGEYVDELIMGRLRNEQKK